MKSSAAKIQVTGLDALFGEAPAQAAGDQIKEIQLAELHPFKDHPFHVIDDEKMQEMAESVAQYGVLVPGIVRPRPEVGYEIVAGHRRRRASELADKATMPVIVRNMGDDETTVIMVDSNLQREKILPSEKAFAYKMRLGAMKHQGKRTYLTSDPMGPKLRSNEMLAEHSPDGITQIKRYIRLTLLNPILLTKVNASRREIEARDMQELADSISQVGLLNPITLMPGHTLLAGRHQLESAKMLGWTEIECTVCEVDGRQS